MNFENKEYLKKLNAKQLEAVIHTDGPLFVIAGAGTGKTRTLTTRIVFLLDNMYASDDEILAVTFTNKAASEMKDRIRTELKRNIGGMWILTFHSLGSRILRSYIELLNIGNLRKDFSIIDESDQKQIIKEILKNLKVENKKTGDVINYISLYKNNNITVNEVLLDDYEKIYFEYNKYLINNNLVDFDDLLIYSYKLLLMDEVLDIYKKRFKYILVDEFQDTSLLQFLIIKKLSSYNNNVFVVGDPDQSIYAFRGASYKNDELFKSHFDAKICVLDDNYRSSNNILDLANNLIKHNKNRIAEKNLSSSINSSFKPEYASCFNENEEAKYVVDKIKQLYAMGYKYKEMAIIYRNNSLSRIYEEALLSSKIKYIVYSGHSFFERREIKDVIAYLRIALDPYNDFYLKRVLNTPSRGIGKTSIEMLENIALERGISLFESTDYFRKRELDKFVSTVLELNKDIDDFESAALFLEHVLEVINYIAYVKEKLDDADDRIENIIEFKNMLTNADLMYPGTIRDKLTSVLEEISLATDIEDKDDKDTDKVILSSYHRVKGLEFAAVFLVAMESSIFPSFYASGDDLDEERRVAYVGVTRAKEFLYLSSATSRFRNGVREYADKSRFIDEMFLTKNNKKVDNSNFLEQPSNIYKEGNKVYHPSFGEGVIVQIKDSILTIAFALPYGIKKILETYKGLEIIK
ncbi:MAG: UvrD-helicase domain-containing protein [Acholeplasmatales bacterium]|jgi:DNA helicase-2/ATP-dependent DNA helicase PcrA|nr:UvrD-helicase domain-containing protein [Acholeplasmatales bacterium]